VAALRAAPTGGMLSSMDPIDILTANTDSAGETATAPEAADWLTNPEPQARRVPWVTWFLWKIEQEAKEEEAAKNANSDLPR